MLIYIALRLFVLVLIKSLDSLPVIPEYYQILLSSVNLTPNNPAVLITLPTWLVGKPQNCCAESHIHFVRFFCTLETKLRLLAEHGCHPSSRIFLSRNTRLTILMLNLRTLSWSTWYWLTFHFKHKKTAEFFMLTCFFFW